MPPSKPRQCEHLVRGTRKEHAIGHCRTCYDRAIRVTGKDGLERVLYCPQDYQLPYHESNVPNLLALGPRATGKSTMMRWDAIIRCLLYPGFKVLFLRRKLTDLRKSHLKFIGGEMRALGCGHYRQNTLDVVFDNGSTIQFSHCENDAALNDYLSSEWDEMVVDELTTFSLDQFTKIQAAVRTTTDKPYIGLVRAGTNWLGPGAAWVADWFVDKCPNLAEYPDYNPADFETQFSTMEQNTYVNRAEYEKRLRNTSETVRKAWLYGERVIEGAFFSDFKPRKRVGGESVPWHCIQELPRWKNQSVLSQGFNIYRSLDWGYDPDPCVCLWHLVLPNGHTITFRERKWLRTLAGDVAAEIKALSAGFRVIETFCDPSMFIKRGDSPYSIADLFEFAGVPLTPAQNDRELYGYAIHEFLNAEIRVGDTLDAVHPRLQIVAAECPSLVRTLPLMQMDPNDPRKMAHGDDHWVEALAYFCMSKAPVSKDPVANARPRWMLPKRLVHQSLAAESLIR